jgi:hypothetical protein
MTAGAAAEEGLHIGSAERLAFFTTAQVNSPSFAGYPADQPYLVIAVKLVGIVTYAAPRSPSSAQPRSPTTTPPAPRPRCSPPSSPPPRSPRWGSP